MKFLLLLLCLVSLAAKAADPFVKLPGLIVTSPLADNATNVAFVVDTANAWTLGGKSIVFKNAGNQFGYIENNADNASFVFVDPLATTNIGFFSVIAGSGGPGGSIVTSSSSIDNYTNYDGEGVLLTDGNGNASITLQSTTDGYTTFWESRLATDVNGGPNLKLTETVSGNVFTKLDPTVTSTGSHTAYLFDTSNVLTNGDKLVSIGNSGTNVFSVNPRGDATIGSVTKAQKTTMAPAGGTIVYQTDNTPGFRVYVNGAWYILSTAADP